MLSSYKKIAHQFYVKVKRKIKRPFYRINATIQVSKSHRILLSEIEKRDVIYLKHRFLNGGGGSLDNYYHFNVDLALPLFVILSSNDRVRIRLMDNGIGYFKLRLKTLFSGRVELIPKDEWLPGEDNFVLGMNPLLYSSSLSLLENFKEYVSKRIGAGLNHSCKSIIVIERGKTNPKKLSKERQLRGSGQDRRSIPNHKEFFELINKLHNPSFKLINVKLEDEEFKDQIEIFDQASLVIAQHGAGLTNALWMKPGTKVIELGNSKLKAHFIRLCKQKEIDHTFFKTSGEHAPIDLTKFEQRIIRDKKFSEFFNVS